MGSAGIEPSVASFVFGATGASVSRVEHVQSLWGGYGALLRLHLAGAPSSVILKDVKAPLGVEDARSHARKCRSYDVELAFYGAHAARTGDACRVARRLGASALPGRWLLLLEDLDAAGYPGRRGRLERDLGPCVSWLAAFHSRFLGASPSGLWPTGTYWHLATRPDELARTSDAELRGAAEVLDRALEGARFKTLLHGDAKPANFCFSPDGRDVAAVDFQYAGGGCGVRDVAYLLHGSTTARGESELLDRYFAELRGALDATAFDLPALEREWRALYPVARADFVRFLAGWAPGSYERGPEPRAVVREALRALG